MRPCPEFMNTQIIKKKKKRKRKRKKPELAGMCYHLMKINRVRSIVPRLGSFVNLLN